MMNTMSETEADSAFGSSMVRPLLLREKLAVLFALLSLLAVAAVHLPWLPLQVQAAGHSFTNLIGQEHRWNMFSADPRGTSVDLWATVEYEDGSTARWTIDRDVAGGDFRFYRLVKWVETAVLIEPDYQLEGFARWVAATAFKPVTRVVVYGREHPPAEPGQARPVPLVTVLFDLDIGGSLAGGDG